MLIKLSIIAEKALLHSLWRVQEEIRHIEPKSYRNIVDDFLFSIIEQTVNCTANKSLQATVLVTMFNFVKLIMPEVEIVALVRKHLKVI